MDEAAKAVMQAYPGDVTLAFGESDEYRFGIYETSFMQYLTIPFQLSLQADLHSVQPSAEVRPYLGIAFTPPD